MFFSAILTLCVLGCTFTSSFGKKSCPDGWVPFKGKCYFISTSKANYYQSLANCYSKESRLTATSSMDEEHFITAYVKIRKDAIWLDGNDNQHEGKYVSSYDNKPLTFTNWASGQPEGKRRENCLANFGDSKWHDTTCSSLYYYACKKEMQHPLDNKQCLGARDLLDELIKCKQRCK